MKPIEPKLNTKPTQNVQATTTQIFQKKTFFSVVFQPQHRLNLL